jgi:phosphate-selective porin OprO/OprP
MPASLFQLKTIIGVFAATLSFVLAPPASADEGAKPTGRIDGGPGRGLVFTTPDESFSIQMRARAQLRGALLVEDEASENEDVIGFNVRRMRLAIRADARPWNLNLYVQLGMAPLDLDPVAPNIVRDAVLTWRPSPAFRLRFGQTKVAFNRERVISSSALAFVDRTLVNAELNLDRDIGVQFLFDRLDGEGHLLAQFGVFGGDGRGMLNQDMGLLYSARLEYRLDPKADDYSEADLRENTARPQLSIGLGGAFNHRSIRSRSTHGSLLQQGSFDQWHGELDFLFKQNGWFLQGELVLRKATRDAFTWVDEAGEEITTRAGSGLGWFLSAGHSFTPEWMVAARFAELRPWSDASRLSNSREVRATLGWFLSDHDFKVQADWGWLFGDDIGRGDFEMRVQTQAFF